MLLPFPGAWGHMGPSQTPLPPPLPEYTSFSSKVAENQTGEIWAAWMSC